MSPREITHEDRLHDAEEALKRHSTTLSIVTMEQGGTKEVLSDHNRRLTAQNEALVLLRADVSAIQEARRARQLEEVRREERDSAHREALEVRLKGIEESTKGIYSLGKWVLTAFGAVLLGAVATFIVNGGLHVAAP